MHLMRHVMVTPQIEYNFLSSSLRDLRFEEVMMTFGLFFIQGLDVKAGVIPDIPEEDDAEAQKAYGKAIVKLPPKNVGLKHLPLELTKHAQKKQCPWGTSVAWAVLEDLLSTIPSQFLRPVDFDQGDLLLQESKFLFMQFSGEIWLSSHSHYLRHSERPKVKDFDAAMAMWTVDGLQGLVRDFIILPSGNGLPGCPPRHPHSQQSFEDRMLTYFPPPNAISSPKMSLLHHYSRDMAYLEVYHGYLRDWDEKMRNRLNSDLRMIFAHIQCLPTATCGKSQKTLVIWEARRGKLQFVANPKYYPLHAIGHPIRPTHATHKAQLPGTTIQQRVFEDK